MIPVKIEVPKQAVEEFCRKWKITEFSFFGSVLREDFGPESDIDVLVKFSPQAHWSLFDLVHMQQELKQLFGREVDLVSRRGIEASPNYLRRKAILGSAEVIYGE
jgi:hypothetical protein